MADIGRFNTLKIVKHTDFGLYLESGFNDPYDDSSDKILLPNRYIPKNVSTDLGDELTVFVYLDSEDRLIATTEKPKAQVGDFASLKVTDASAVGIFLDWGLPKDVLLPYSETKRTLKPGDYCLVYLYLDDKTRRITATTYLDNYLDLTPARYQVGEAVNLLVAGRTDIGYKAIINNSHWGLIHNNEVFKFLRSGMAEQGFIKEIRPDGKINLSLQPVGGAGRDALQTLILEKLAAAGGTLPLGDKSSPEVISRMFGVSKGSFKKAIGALFKQGKIVIAEDCIEMR